MIFHNKYFFFVKWILVILTILFISQGALVIVVLTSLLYLSNKIDNLDILLVFFLNYFIQNGLTDVGGMIDVRYILIVLLIVKPLIKNGRSKFNVFSIFIDSEVSILLFVYIFINSLLISIKPEYSLSQTIIFLALVLFTYKGTFSPEEVNFEDKKQNLLSMFIAILFLSILVLPFPDIAYARNGNGFQGVTVHPNAFGVFVAPFCGYFLLNSLRNKGFFNFLLFLSSLIFLLLSQSRTSLFSLLLGLLVYFLINSEFRFKFTRVLIYSLVPLTLIILLNLSKIAIGLNGFLNKSGAESFSESVTMSRGALFDAQLSNIKENFIFGIGFKVPSNLGIESDVSIKDKLSYEKGNMLTACVEELGFFGTVLFLLFLIGFLRKRSRYRNAFQILPIIAVFTSLGEATLFSIGGLGILIWTLIFLNRFNYAIDSNNMFPSS